MQSMTKKERVLAAMDNRPVDRVPMGFWYHFSSEDCGQKTVDDHLAFYRGSGNDFIKIMCDGFFNYPNPQIAGFTAPSDWKQQKPMGPDSEWVRRQAARAKAVKEAVGDECCVFYNVFNPMSLFRFETSDERLMGDLKADPEAVCAAFRAIGEDVKSLVKALFEEAKLDGIYFCVQNAETFRFTEEEYKKYVMPYELEILEYANTFSNYNILHCCGWAGDKNRIEVWKDYPAKCINWAVYVENMKLSEGKKFFGGKCVLGGFANTKAGILYSGSEEAIRRETDRLIEEAGNLGVIIGADCTMPADIDWNRFRIVSDELNKIGSKKGPVPIR